MLPWKIGMLPWNTRVFCNISWALRWFLAVETSPKWGIVPKLVGLTIKHGGSVKRSNHMKTLFGRTQLVSWSTGYQPYRDLGTEPHSMLRKSKWGPVATKLRFVGEHSSNVTNYGLWLIMIIHVVFRTTHITGGPTLHIYLCILFRLDRVLHGFHFPDVSSDPHSGRLRHRFKAWPKASKKTGKYLVAHPT